MRRIAMVCTVAAILVSWSCGQGSAKPYSPIENRWWGKTLRIPLPDEYMDLYAQAVEPQLEYRLEEAFCTRDDFSDDLLKKLEKTYRLLPVTFGKPDAPEDPIEYARSSLFGESTLTNALRHDMCSGEGSSKGNPYPAASTYYQELTDEIALVGTNPLPELEKLSEQKQQQAITNIWNTRTNALRTHLSNWLPTGT